MKTIKSITTIITLILHSIVFSQDSPLGEPGTNVDSLDPPALTFPTYVPTNGLVGYWGFNGNANDLSGNGNNGTVNGATLTTDRNGNANSAYSFDGASQWIEVPNSNSLNPTTQLSISVWCQSTFTANYINVGVVGKWNNYGTGNVIQSAQYVMQITEQGMKFNTYTSQQRIASETTNNSNNGLWHNYVGSWDGQTMKLYRDGVLISTMPQLGEINANSQGLEFGRYAGGTGTGANSNYFNGQIDDIAIYNRALSQAEISQLYTATVGTSNNTNTSTAQVPQKMSYQSVVRNASNQIVANQNVGVKISIVEGSLTGTTVYSETHQALTNANGLFSLETGGGTPATGTFSGINWGNGSHYIKSEIDVTGGTNYNLSGTMELLSVPYALFAANAGNTTAGPTGATGPQGIQGVAGANGTNGTNGLNGLSAYEIWLNNGNFGTQQQFLTSLQGAPGTTGQTGTSAYQTWLGLGNTGTEQDFINSLANNSSSNSSQSISDLFLTSNNFDLIDFRIDNNGAFVFFGRLIGDSVKIFNTTLTGINKYVLFKMNANLTFVWAKTINSNVIYYGYGHSLAIDNMNNIFVLADSNLIKFDSNGIQQFNIITYGQYGFGLAIDNQQNVYTFSGTNIGSSNYNANTGAVNKYTNTGTFLWAYSITDVFNGFDLIFDNLDNVILGFTSYSIQKILKINSSGSLVWSKGSTCNGTTIPCPNGSKFWLVALQNGDVYAMTDANTSINMGGITSTVIRLAASDGAPTQISYSNLGNECASYKPILNKNTNQIYSFGLRSNSNNSNDRSLLLNRFDASISTFGVTDKFSGYAYIDFDSSSTAFIILNNYNLSNLSPTLSQGYIFTIPGSSRIQIYKLRP